jgi:hypothetical protein
MATTLPDRESRTARTIANTRQGALPVPLDGKLWVGHGSGKACSGCGDSINPIEREFERDYLGTLTFRFHAECYGAWSSAASGDEHAAPGGSG